MAKSYKGAVPGINQPAVWLPINKKANIPQI